MKTLIFGAGPLGSLYATLLHKAGKDVTLLARNEHYQYLKKNGVVLDNEFTNEIITEPVRVTNTIDQNIEYDLVIVIMRKNSLKKVLPLLGRYENFNNFLFMGNNLTGFDEYLHDLPNDRVLFGFPGGGGSRIDHVVHYIDSEKPGGKRMAVTLGEIDGRIKDRTRQIQDLFESSGVPTKVVDDIDNWLKYHVAFVYPVAGALLKSGDNYQLANDPETIRTYIRAVKEAGSVLKALGYKNRYNSKMKLFHFFPEFVLVKVLKGVFNSRFAEVAMMMHVNAARDEMNQLCSEFQILKKQSQINTPNLDKIEAYIR